MIRNFSDLLAKSVPKAQFINNANDLPNGTDSKT